MEKNVWKWDIFFVILQLKLFNMFIGEYDAKLDEKGRVVLPFQLLRQLDDKQDEKVFVIKKDIYEKNLLLFPIAEWKNQNDIL